MRALRAQRAMLSAAIRDASDSGCSIHAFKPTLRRDAITQASRVIRCRYARYRRATTFTLPRFRTHTPDTAARHPPPPPAMPFSLHAHAHALYYTIRRYELRQSCRAESYARYSLLLRYGIERPGFQAIDA